MCSGKELSCAYSEQVSISQYKKMRLKLPLMIWNSVHKIKGFVVVCLVWVLIMM
jgi:hypothetical protein